VRGRMPNALEMINERFLAVIPASVIFNCWRRSADVGGGRLFRFMKFGRIRCKHVVRGPPPA